MKRCTAIEEGARYTAQGKIQLRGVTVHCVPWTCLLWSTILMNS
jgi:hypothetical protein